MLKHFPLVKWHLNSYRWGASVGTSNALITKRKTTEQEFRQANVKRQCYLIVNYEFKLTQNEANFRAQSSSPSFNTLPVGWYSHSAILLNLWCVIYRFTITEQAFFKTSEFKMYLPQVWYVVIIYLMLG